MEGREREIRKVTLWGAAVNITLTIAKLLAGVFGRSAAMVADGVHSLSDLLTDAIVLIFTHISSKGKDRDHSFGHGKFETMATLIISVILIVVGAKLMEGGIRSIIDTANGKDLPKPGYIALIAAIVSIVLKELLYHWTAILIIIPRTASLEYVSRHFKPIETPRHISSAKSRIAIAAPTSPNSSHKIAKIISFAGSDT
jgi:divalent metal cation (Fe/Co/Zn/Cd) transporter